MLETVEGVYQDGKVELKEYPPGVQRARVLVTFLAEEDEGAERRMLQYGKYASAIRFSEDDFKAAEWHSESTGNDGR